MHLCSKETNSQRTKSWNFRGSTKDALKNIGIIIYMLTIQCSFGKGVASSRNFVGVVSRPSYQNGLTNKLFSWLLRTKEQIESNK